MTETNEEQILADEKKVEECCGGGPKVEEEIFVHEVSGAGQPVIVNPVNPVEELDEE
jgi:hypothetical protein